MILIVLAVFLLEKAGNLFLPSLAGIWVTILLVIALRSREPFEFVLPIAGVSLLFDVFSGFPFGYSTLALIAVIATMSIVKRWINLNTESVLLCLMFSSLCIMEFLLLLSWQIPLDMIIKQLPVILVKNAVVTLLVFSIKPKHNALHSTNRLQNISR